MEYGAIDLHTKESQIRIVTSDGRVVLDQRIATRRDRFTWLFGERPAMRILLETGTESEWVAQHLESLGHEVVVADPNYAPMYGERTRRIKTPIFIWPTSEFPICPAGRPTAKPEASSLL